MLNPNYRNFETEDLNCILLYTDDTKVYKDEEKKVYLTEDEVKEIGLNPVMLYNPTGKKYYNVVVRHLAGLIGESYLGVFDDSGAFHKVTFEEA